MSPEKQPVGGQASSESDHSERSILNYNTESSCLSTMTNTTLTTAGTERDNAHRNSDASVASAGLIRSGSVVHGFSPIPSSLRSRGSSTLTKTLPILASKDASNGVTRNKAGMFTLGGSSEDDESSFEVQMSYRKHLLEPRKSSLSRSLNDQHAPSQQPQQPQQKKTTSFREIIEQHTIQTGGSSADDNAIASDDEDDDDDSVIDDSAIEEDDEEGWEDEQPEEEKAQIEPVFKRIDSTVNLTSRRSVLTAGLTEGDRAKGLVQAAQNSRSSPAIRRVNRAASHHGPSLATSPEENEDDGAVMMNTRSIPMPPPKDSVAYVMAHSPRTTRRNMLSTELTESLRKNLLWERQQKNTTVNAFLKREAKSMANLQRAGQAAAAQSQPYHVSLQRDPTKNNNSFNDYFNVTNEYHAKGW